MNIASSNFPSLQKLAVQNDCPREQGLIAADAFSNPCLSHASQGNGGCSRAEVPSFKNRRDIGLILDMISQDADDSSCLESLCFLQTAIEQNDSFDIFSGGLGSDTVVALLKTYENHTNNIDVQHLAIHAMKSLLEKSKSLLSLGHEFMRKCMFQRDAWQYPVLLSSCLFSYFCYGPF